MLKFTPNRSVEEDVHLIINHAKTQFLTLEHCNMIAGQLYNTNRYPKPVMLQYQNVRTSQLALFVKQITNSYYNLETDLTLNLFPKLQKYITDYVASYFLLYKNDALKLLCSQIISKTERIPLGKRKQITCRLRPLYSAAEYKVILAKYPNAEFECNAYNKCGSFMLYNTSLKILPVVASTLTEDLQNLPYLRSVKFTINVAGTSRKLKDYLRPSNWFLSTGKSVEYAI